MKALLPGVAWSGLHCEKLTPAATEYRTGRGERSWGWGDLTVVWREGLVASTGLAAAETEKRLETNKGHLVPPEDLRFGSQVG